MPIPTPRICLRGCPAGRLRGPIGGLVFDAGDVLYDATAWRRWLLQLLARLGLHTNYRCFWHVWDHEFLVPVHRGQRDFREAFRHFLLAVGLNAAQIDEIERACHGRRHQWEANVRLLPGVRSTLARLKAVGLPMIVLSDSEHTGEELGGRLERLGLKDVFVEVITSVDLGHTKPEAACYRAALRAMWPGHVVAGLPTEPPAPDRRSPGTVGDLRSGGGGVGRPAPNGDRVVAGLPTEPPAPDRRSPAAVGDLRSGGGGVGRPAPNGDGPAPNLNLEPAPNLNLGLMPNSLGAGQVAFVGHDTVELRGAADVGMQTIALNYSPDAEADVFLSRFDELFELVGAPTADRAVG